MDFQKAFEAVLPAQLMQRPKALGIPIDMQWGIYVLHECMSGKVWFPNSLSKVLATTIGAKQTCAHSPTLFGQHRGHANADRTKKYLVLAWEDLMNQVGRI